MGGSSSFSPRAQIASSAGPEERGREHFDILGMRAQWWTEWGGPFLPQDPSLSLRLTRLHASRPVLGTIIDSRLFWDLELVPGLFWDPDLISFVL